MENSENPSYANNANQLLVSTVLTANETRSDSDNRVPSNTSWSTKSTISTISSEKNRTG